jgi:hypothetical protein
MTHGSYYSSGINSGRGDRTKSDVTLWAYHPGCEWFNGWYNRNTVPNRDASGKTRILSPEYFQCNKNSGDSG